LTDRLSLLIEADKRGLLPPEKKAMLAEALKRGIEADKPTVVSAGEALRQIPRQVGLTARYGAEGLADVAGIVTEPIRAIMNPALRAVGLPGAPSTRSMVSGFADKAGLPSPQGPTERVVGDATRLMAGGGGLAGTAGKVSELVTGPVAKTVSTAMAANKGTQVASAAGAGAAGGSVREAGGGPVEQFVASLAGGLTTAGLMGLATKAYDTIARSVKNLMAPGNDVTQINVVLNQILERNGVKVSQLPPAVRNDLAAEVKRALDTGKELNPDAIRRIADYGSVGATPTKGTATLDPVQITQERNLAKVGANSQDPRLQELSRVQNTNNAKLIENLNKMGADSPNANPVVAGEQALGVIKARDASARATEKSLYAKARDSSGRAIELDREGFVFDAYNRLAESNKGAFLPENIKTVLEQLKSGKVTMGGKEYPVPFTVDTIDNLKTMLSTASRGAQDGNIRAALSQVRNALEATQPKAVGRPVGGNQVVDPAALSAAQGQADDASAVAMGAFDKARQFSRARHNWQESAEGIRAALDDVAPDRFVKDYILSSGNKAATAEVERMLFTVRKDPQAMQALKENVVSYLKSKALGNAADEVGNFSASGFNRALKEFGDHKLKLFFTNEEIGQLKALGRVASYETVQPRGSAVNNSNTTGAVVGVLDRIASSPLIGRIPFGEAALRQPAKNWSAQISARNAMEPYLGITRAPEKVPMGSVQDLIGPGLLLAAPRADSRNDEKRR
jgi:hypothetical protein